MKFRVERPKGPLTAHIQLPTSKSVSNRALIIQALCGSKEKIEGLSEADDTQKLKRLLTEMPRTFDVGNAGTAMRFLCAYLSITPGTWILTGSERMQQRPIGPLVEALLSLGAEIEYLGQKGFPPLKIVGRVLEGGKVHVESALSSQFASALMMVGPYMKDGLRIETGATMASRSYLEMTKSVMAHFGVDVEERPGEWIICEGKYVERRFRIPADHSSAAYWAGIAALSPGSEFLLEGLQLDDPQGDRCIFEILAPLLQVEQNAHGVLIRHIPEGSIEQMDSDLSSTPDLFPTLAFTAAALGVHARFRGSESLPHKETDRLRAVQLELANVGVTMQIKNDHSVEILASKLQEPLRPFKSYDDHRMVMSAAMLASFFEHIEIEDPMVVEKSYPTFWADIEAAGFGIKSIG